MIEALIVMASLVSPTECQIDGAYDRLFGREPTSEVVGYWSNEPSTERLIERLAGTPEGSGRDWAANPDWWPHVANEIDAGCVTHPAGWVDLGHGVYGPAVLLDIRWCESRDNYWAKNPRSSAAGGYQFLTSTWRWVTGRSDTALNATPAEQDAAAVRLATMPGGGLQHWVCY